MTMWKWIKSLWSKPSNAVTLPDEWAGYCSEHRILAPCHLEHKTDAHWIPFRLYPKAGESRYQGYELRDIYGESFPLWRDELPPEGWKPSPKPIKLSQRWISGSNLTDWQPTERCMGSDGQLNAYGCVAVEEYNPSTPSLTVRTIPVICGHGGSGWLCGSCADAIKKSHGL